MDGRTEMTKIIVAFRDFAKAPGSCAYKFSNGLYKYIVYIVTHNNNNNNKLVHSVSRKTVFLPDDGSFWAETFRGLSKFFYLPTDAQENYFKIYIKTAATCFGSTTIM
jgi:hypothetical protein